MPRERYLAIDKSADQLKTSAHKVGIAIDVKQAVRLCEPKSRSALG